MRREIEAESAEQGSLHAFVGDLYPICRSITGAGVRQTLKMIAQQIPLREHEIPSGSRVYDWTVPDEWNIEDAWIKDSHGAKVIDFQQHNLHVVSYSEPVHSELSFDELNNQLHSIPEHPSWIPYRTSYYKRGWGMCLQDEIRSNLGSGRYTVKIDSDLRPGVLNYGQYFQPGKVKKEFLFFTHICHPSLANDNCSGMAVATALARWLATRDRYFSYRVVFAPGTIGSLCWLKQNEDKLGNIKHGLVIGLLGDSANLTYKKSRTGNRAIDQIVPFTLRSNDIPVDIMDFEPYGYDERQLCSLGFDLPVGRLTRSVNSGYPEYHSSADNLDLITEEQLQKSLDGLKAIVRVAESNRSYINMSPMGEPQLGKRGLYGDQGGRAPAELSHAMLWLLSQCDGSNTLIDIANTSGMSYDVLRIAAEKMSNASLLTSKREDS